MKETVAFCSFHWYLALFTKGSACITFCLHIYAGFPARDHGLKGRKRMTKRLPLFSGVFGIVPSTHLQISFKSHQEYPEQQCKWPFLFWGFSDKSGATHSLYLMPITAGGWGLAHSQAFCPLGYRRMPPFTGKFSQLQQPTVALAKFWDLLKYFSLRLSSPEGSLNYELF